MLDYEPDPYSVATKIAVDALSRRARSRGELAQLLQKRAVPEDVAQRLLDRLEAQRLVDDRAFAGMKADGLARRGDGPRRVRQALDASGIGAEDAHDALQAARESAEQAALAFARRRRIGPYASSPPDPRQREKAMGAMLRAGHDYALARRILDLPLKSVQSEDGYSGGEGQA